MENQKKVRDQKINQYQNTEDKEDNMVLKNGKTRFTQYSTMDISLYFPKGKKRVETIQFTFGGICESELEDLNRNVSLLKHSLKQLLYRKSKDGYFKKEFLFISKFPDFYHKTGSGLVYFDVFLHLEEPYEKKFITEHLLTIFEEIENIYKQNKFFKFRKYGKIKES